jgi:DNA-binding response OmpR family regulator
LTKFERSAEGHDIRILISEDEPALAKHLADAVSAVGFIADIAADGPTALHLGQVNNYDAVILDLGLPGLSGLEVLRQWRQAGRTMPVIILSARGTWSERVEGLNHGADDYMAKPFHAAEVVARLRALSRRASGVADPMLRHGRVTINLVAKIAYLDGQDIDLTAHELKVLTYLMQRPTHVISQGELAKHAYGPSDTRSSNTIEVFVARLRSKLGHEAIRTVRGLGYKMGGV